MAIPKIDRESNLFEKNVCDRLNKKVQLLQDNMNKLYVPPLEPEYDVNELTCHIEVDRIYSSKTTGGYYYTDSDGHSVWVPKVEHKASCKPVIKTNNSFSISSGNSAVYFLNLEIELTDVSYSVSGDKPSNGGYVSLDGKMAYIGRVNKSPVCDVWFAGLDGGFLIHIPAGENKLYIVPLLSTKVAEVYTYYV